MQRTEQIRIIEGLLSHLDNGTNVDAGGQMRNPVTAYTDAGRASKEWQKMFATHPHVIGLSGDLPEAGSFFTNTDLGKPILCTRDKSGTFRAFLNVCRHRGTIVENDARGQKNLFSCPFHAWGYDPTGALVAVPKEEHFGPVDRECNSLVALPAVEKYGMLWVSAQPERTFDVDALLGEDLASELGEWDLGNMERLSDAVYHHPMNWKLAIDTFGETYHFNTLHRDTLANSFYGNAQMYDTYQQNHRMMLCMRSIDGLRNLPREQWHVLMGALPVYFIYPNVQLIIGVGGPTLVRVYPRGENPNDSYSQVSFYLNPKFEGERLSVQERMEGFGSVIEAEDYVAAASSHVGALSGAQDYVTFGRNEPALHHYHNTYNRALGLPELDLVGNQ